MSDETILASHVERIADGRTALEQRLEPEPWDDFGAFGWLRGVRERALMLELRKKTGTVLAIGYGWLEKVEFAPSDGITLHIVGQRITIKGRNLNAEVRPLVRLFEGIARHRVPWIRETSHGELLRALNGACIIETINW